MITAPCAQRIFLWILCTATLCLITGCVTYTPGQPRAVAMAEFVPEKVDRIAVVVQDATGELRRAHGILRQVEDEFIQQLVAKGYRLPDRTLMDTVIKEQRFQHGGFTDNDAVRLGRILNVPTVLVVAVTKVDTSSHETPFMQNRRRVMAHYAHASISARLVSAETSEVLWIGTHSDRSQIQDTRRQSLDGVQATARALAVAFPDRFRSSEEGTDASGRQSD